MAERPEFLDERWTPFEEAAYRVHDLMIIDCLWWSAETSNWRFRFEFKGHGQVGHQLRLRRNNAWLDKQVRMHCSGGSKVTGYTGAVYLEKDQDALQMFQTLRHHTIERNGVAIASVQSRAVWLAAVAASEVLCQGYRKERLWRLQARDNHTDGDPNAAPG